MFAAKNLFFFNLFSWPDLGVMLDFDVNEF